VTTVGLIIFYIGFFGFFIGLGAAIRGNLQILRINNRKQALLLVLLSFVLAIVGSMIIGPGPENTLQ